MAPSTPKQMSDVQSAVATLRTQQNFTLLAILVALILLAGVSASVGMRNLDSADTVSMPQQTGIGVCDPFCYHLTTLYYPKVVAPYSNISAAHYYLGCVLDCMGDHTQNLTVVQPLYMDVLQFYDDVVRTERITR